MMMYLNRRGRFVPSLAAATLLAGSAALAMPSFGGWAGPSSLETLPGSASTVNTTSVDGCASHSQDGLKIAFNSNRGGTQDIYVASRASKWQGFGTPERLPSPVNSATADEFCPTIGRGNRLYFSSTRSGDIGDLYVAKIGPKGWSNPVLLGGGVNTPSMEESTAFYEDDQGREVMLFSRRLADGSGGKIYQSIAGAPPTLVAGGPHSSASDNRPSVTHDGRTIFFDSTRFGTLGGPDIWYATRSSTSDAFGQAVHLSGLNSSAFDARPFISWDGGFLTFSSARAGNESPAPDIWFSTREKGGAD